MEQCVALAQQSLGRTGLNPCVGAAVVRDGVVISLAHHDYFGDRHAEDKALSMAGDAAQGADLYVTLEPCCTHGKRPPCTDAIIAAGIKRVIIGASDPFLEHSGRGIATLQAHGIMVVLGVALDSCARLIEPFAKHVLTKRPYITLKIGQSLDGKIALANGESQWITSPACRLHTHQLRAQHPALITGVGTVLVDNPSLNVRLQERNHSLIKIVLDSSGRTPPNARIFESCPHDSVWIVTDNPTYEPPALENVRVIQRDPHDIDGLLAYIYSQGIGAVMVEAGQAVTTAFLQGFADSLHVAIAPLLLGPSALASFSGHSLSRLADASRFLLRDARPMDSDILAIYALSSYTESVVRLTHRVQSQYGC